MTAFYKVTALKINQRSIIRSLALIFTLISCIGVHWGYEDLGSRLGGLLVNFTIQDTAPVLDGSYSYDLNGIHIPPISSDFNISMPFKGKNSQGRDVYGYAYNAEGIYMPALPNDFTVFASKVKNLNIGVKKSQGNYENSSMVWKDEKTRIWVTSQIEAE